MPLLGKGVCPYWDTETVMFNATVTVINWLKLFIRFGDVCKLICVSCEFSTQLPINQVNQTIKMTQSQKQNRISSLNMVSQRCEICYEEVFFQFFFAKNFAIFSNSACRRLRDVGVFSHILHNVHCSVAALG